MPKLTITSLQTNLVIAVFYKDTKAMIFPNPTSTDFLICANSAIEEMFKMAIYGKAKLKRLPNTATIAIDLSGFEKGVYFIKMRFDSSFKTEKSSNNKSLSCFIKKRNSYKLKVTDKQ